MWPKQFSTMRIDIALAGGGRRYFFLAASDVNWHPWWEILHAHLASLSSPIMQWKHEPVQRVCYATVTLSERQRDALLTLLRSAPPTEISGHRSLGKSIEELAAGRDTAVTFFRNEAEVTPSAK